MPKKEALVIDTDFPPSSREATAARLGILREALGYTVQQDWCAVVGIKQPAWSQYERDIHKITSDAAIAICDRFPGLTTDWIYRGLDGTILPSYRERIQEIRHARKRKRDMMGGGPVAPKRSNHLASAR
jgi:hypothetical protein